VQISIACFLWYLITWVGANRVRPQFADKPSSQRATQGRPYKKRLRILQELFALFVYAKISKSIDKSTLMS
jgi:hypothetical protein